MLMLLWVPEKNLMKGLFDLSPIGDPNTPNCEPSVFVQQGALRTLRSGHHDSKVA